MIDFGFLRRICRWELKKGVFLEGDIYFLGKILKLEGWGEGGIGVNRYLGIIVLEGICEIFKFFDI